MKMTRKVLICSAACALAFAAVPVSISLLRAGNAPQDFTNEITPTKPGKGETVSFLPKAISDFYNLENLYQTYAEKNDVITDLLPYSEEGARWANYINNPADYYKAIELYDKFDLFRPTNNLLAWDSSLDAKEYKVIVSQDSKFKTIEREYVVSGSENSVTFDNPYTGCTYYWQVIATKQNDKLAYSDIFSFNVADLPRTIYIPGISNTRDLGGRTNLNGEKMKEGLVYRGNLLEPTTEIGKVEFKTNLGIKTEIDLRNIGEGAENALSLPNYYHCPSPYDAVDASVNDFSNIANVSGTNSNCLTFGNAIKAMGNKNNYPLYFHCSVGRDRTGWMGICLDYLCGMSEEVALKEFILSLFSCAGAYLKGNLEFYNRFNRITDYLKTFSGNTIQEKTEDYLVKHCGVTHQDCENVRDVLLGKVDTGYFPGKVNTESYEGYSRVTFRRYGQDSIIKLVQNGSLLDDPRASGNGTWYHGDQPWNFATDTVEDDMYLDYIEPAKNKVVIHFIGIDREDEILNVADGESIDFNQYALEGYTFKVFDSDFIEVTSATISGDAIYNIVYKSNAILTPKANSRVIVMAGQSNAAGVGHYEYLKTAVSDAKLAEINHGFDNVLMRGYSHRPIDEFRPVYADEDYNTCTGAGTFGFEVSLADRLSKIYPDETIYIVKYALGASNLAYDWCPPSFRDKTSATSGASGGELGCLYDGMVQSVHESLDWIKQNTNTYPVIDAFMWMQGESGALTYSYLDEYFGLWNAFLDDFDKEFKNNFGYKFAYYDAAISEYGIWPLAREMNQFKKSLESENYIYVDTVSKGLTTEYEPYGITDPAHYDAACYMDLGHYFADLYIAHSDYTYKPAELKIEVPERITLGISEGTASINPTVKFNGSTVASDCLCVSKNRSIVEVDENGVVTPVSAGSTSIKVQTYYNGECHTEQISVRVFEGKVEDALYTTFKDEAKFHYSGRNAMTDDKVTFINTLSGFETTFVGKELKAKMIGTLGDSYYIPCPQTISIRVYVDDDTEGKIVKVPLTASSTAEVIPQEIVLAEFETSGTHTVKVQKVNYERRGYIEMTELYGPTSFVEKVDTRKKALILGDSITVGCGINGKGSNDSYENEDGTLTYAAQFVNANNLNAQLICITGISLGAPVFWRRTMADIYKQYSYSYATEYDLSEFVPDIILINLGTNDSGALQTQPNQYGDYRTAEDVYNGAMTIISGLREVYKTSTMLFTFGMMGYDNVVASSIQRALSDYSLTINNEFKSLQAYMKYDVSETSPTYAGHPTPICHKKAFNQINNNDLIKKALGL